MNQKSQKMKKKLLVVSHRPIYGIELLKREIGEVFSDLFDIIHLTVISEPANSA
jgi:hypothetical protein